MVPCFGLRRIALSPTNRDPAHFRPARSPSPPEDLRRPGAARWRRRPDARATGRTTSHRAGRPGAGDVPGNGAGQRRTGPRLAGQELPEATARELVTRAGLEPQFLPQDAGALSGGEKLRVAVARALAIRPEIWLLDEPTAALDVERAQMLVRLLRELAVGGAAMLVVSHDARALERLEGRHLQLVGGRLTEEIAVEGPS